MPRRAELRAAVGLADQQKRSNLLWIARVIETRIEALDLEALGTIAMLHRTVPGSAPPPLVTAALDALNIRLGILAVDEVRRDVAASNLGPLVSGVLLGVRARSALAAGAIDPAQDLLDELAEQAGVAVELAITERVLRAELAIARGWDVIAQQLFREAVALAAPDRNLRAVLDALVSPLLLLSSTYIGPHETFVVELSAADAARTRPQLASSPATLRVNDLVSSRELEVIRLLPTRLSNAEIADTLNVSVNTVKTHMRNIYAKFGTTNRNAAIRHAEELGLL